MSEQENSPDAGLVRLSKRMGELGICSRREADSWIEKGWVSVDGVKITELGTKIRPDQKITINNAAKTEQAEKVTILLNKPLGYVSGQAEDGYEPAKVLVTDENHWSEDPVKKVFKPFQRKGLVPAGRLDINSTGLLVLTQDGRVAKKLIGEESNVDKEYIVRVTPADGTSNADFPEEKLQLLNFGLEIDGKKLLRAKVEWINDNQLRFVLREGRNRQIRKMCEAVGLKVLQLKRVRIGGINLGKLPVGKWRYLQENESFEASSHHKKTNFSYSKKSISPKRNVNGNRKKS
ncbi:pseudouridine synthase [uncultured Turicimonas sp.]|uniref:pseudouridine synthase n=1 Tax=uncultured Turicimonas sp. TaxID=1918607 RepID=UPI0028045AE2|nr:pseudouridine synthase [uncultured Turicimonas sp.]